MKVFLISLAVFWLVAPFVVLIATEFHYGLSHRNDPCVPKHDKETNTTTCIACNDAFSIGPTKWLVGDAIVNCITLTLIVIAITVGIIMGFGEMKDALFGAGACAFCLLSMVAMFKLAWAIFGAVMLANTDAICVGASRPLWSMLLAADVLAFLVIW